MKSIRSWLRLSILGAVLLGSQAYAQTYPSRPVRVVIPYAAGGALDIMGRTLAKEFHEMNGQPYVVENKGGAGGTIAAADVAKAAPDGYTLLLGAIGPISIAPAVYGASAGFNPARDLAPITLVATAPLVLVSNMALPVKSVAELIAHAKKQSGKMNYASAGTGGPDHLAGELFKSMAGLAAEHIPYKGSGPALTDAMGGQIQYLFVSPLPAMPMVEAGKLRLLAVAGKSRSPTLPAIPTVAETLPGFEVVPWWGFFAPAGTPPSVIAKVAADAKKVIARDDIKQSMRKRGVEADTNTPQEFAAFLRADLVKWTRIVKDAGVKPD
jgi:tripartite-type tricarboxylate transporter receptor subunit TctC